MSVNIKNIFVKTVEPKSKNVEEFLVERYEGLVSKSNLLNSVGRWIYVSILFIGLIFPFSYRSSDISIFYFLIPFFIAFGAYTASTLGLMSEQIKIEEKISNLEKEIIKIQLEKEFQHDEELKSRFEDFYIRFNILTQRKIREPIYLISIEFFIYFLIYWTFSAIIKSI